MRIIFRVILRHDLKKRARSWTIVHNLYTYMATQVVLVVKNPPRSAGDTRDLGAIPKSGRSPGERMATHASILTWRIPWTEDPGKLQSVGSQSVRHDSATDHIHIHI